MALERDIHRLLYTHDCVIVPGFGGFLTHYRPARLDEQRRTVYPPAKDLSFNRHLVRNDGLLTDEVAKREGLDHTQAMHSVDAVVNGWQRRLDTDGRLELGQIGTFFRDAEKNLQFEPDKRINFLKDAYGLRAVAAVALLKAEPLAVPVVPVVPMIKQPAALPEEPARRTSGFLMAAASVAVLVTAATWWVVTTNGPVNATWSGFDLFGSDQPARYHPAPAVNMVTVDPMDTLGWSVPEGLSGVQLLPIAGADAPAVAVDLGTPAPLVVPESTAVAVPTVTHSRYHIIGGCFGLKENADKFVADLQAKGFAASVLDIKGGLYRVAYGSYPQRAMALEALSAVRKEVAPQAWMLVK